MLTHLQNQVIDFWENEGIKYFNTQDIGIDNTHYESLLKPEFEEVLNDRDACSMELGHDSYKKYLEYLELNEIKAPSWVKKWAKKMLKKERTYV